MAEVILKPGREKSVLKGHPWIFSGAIRRVEGSPPNGSIVQVLDADRTYLATGYINRRSQIRIRILTRDRGESITPSFFHRRLAESIERRRQLFDSTETNAFRLVFAESDFLPGLIVDLYDGFLVVQCLTLGIERWKGVIADALVDLLHPQGIYERSDVETREKEDLPPIRGVLRGDTPPEQVEIKEHGFRFLVDVMNGQKTGFYLDQRENRRKVMFYSTGRDVLNCFAYTGGFSVYAASGGATSVTEVDVSSGAMEVGRRIAALNELNHTHFEQRSGNAFQVLREWRDSRRRFDLVILDPPRFASSKGQLPAAARGYKDINMLAMHLLRPGGVLCTFSCSGLVSAELFQKIVFSASVDAHREAQIIDRLCQGADHPALLSFPESRYLKGLICRVI